MASHRRHSASSKGKRAASSKSKGPSTLRGTALRFASSVSVAVRKRANKERIGNWVKLARKHMANTAKVTNAQLKKAYSLRRRFGRKGLAKATAALAVGGGGAVAYKKRSAIKRRVGSYVM